MHPSAHRVEGAVKVERGATLKASGIRVKGNVQAEAAKFVAIAASTVGGSIRSSRVAARPQAETL